MVETRRRALHGKFAHEGFDDPFVGDAVLGDEYNAVTIGTELDEGGGVSGARRSAVLAGINPQVRAGHWVRC